MPGGKELERTLYSLRTTLAPDVTACVSNCLCGGPGAVSSIVNGSNSSGASCFSLRKAGAASTSTDASDELENMGRSPWACIPMYAGPALGSEAIGAGLLCILPSSLSAST